MPICNRRKYFSSEGQSYKIKSHFRSISQSKPHSRCKRLHENTWLMSFVFTSKLEFEQANLPTIGKVQDLTVPSAASILRTWPTTAELTSFKPFFTLERRLDRERCCSNSLTPLPCTNYTQTGLNPSPFLYSILGNQSHAIQSTFFRQAKQMLDFSSLVSNGIHIFIHMNSRNFKHNHEPWDTSAINRPWWPLSPIQVLHRIPAHRHKRGRLLIQSEWWRIGDGNRARIGLERTERKILSAGEISWATRTKSRQHYQTSCMDSEMPRARDGEIPMGKEWLSTMIVRGIMQMLRCGTTCQTNRPCIRVLYSSRHQNWIAAEDGFIGLSHGVFSLLPRQHIFLFLERIKRIWKEGNDLFFVGEVEWLLPR